MYLLFSLFYPLYICIFIFEHTVYPSLEISDRYLLGACVDLVSSLSSQRKLLCAACADCFGVFSQRVYERF